MLMQETVNMLKEQEHRLKHMPDEEMTLSFKKLRQCQYKMQYKKRQQAH